MPKDKILCHSCLNGRFYAKLAIKYLMASFYATAIGAKCIMNNPLGDIHTYIKGRFYANQSKYA